ncbi:MAG TPA: hypothetical protein VMV10_30325 [Pirellulales bacterium]|nr:hypothetical protein [Pirellulales bacterium]
MREHLLGYLLGALEPAENELVAARLVEDPALQADLEWLRSKVAPLAADEEDYDPPEGLAARTCTFVAARTRPKAARSPVLAPGGAPPGGSWLAPGGNWRVQDLLVAGGICIAASLLVFPAISHSQFNSRLTACQNNLREIGSALGHYSQIHNGYFPLVPQQGRLAVAGIYAPTLREARLLPDNASLICPSSSLACEEAFALPTLDEVRVAKQEELPQLYRRMGGSYGYSLGYVANGVYRGHRNRGRSNFALMADAPDDDSAGRSLNHGSCGQNVLFEDMHVGFLKSCRLTECDDHIYMNDQGLVGAGIGPDDAVIGRSPARPVILKAVSGR